MKNKDQSSSVEFQGDASDAPVDLRLPAALVRTALSSEQTLMSWVRSSLSLFTFGFSITQFFYFLAQSQEDPEVAAGPRRLGISLIVVGIVVLVLGLFEHLKRIRHLKDQGLPEDAGSFLPIGSTAAILVIGVVALVCVFLNWNL
jgi:putative membrane protein